MGSGGGGGSLTTSGCSKDMSKDSIRSKAPTKAGLKALDLAVTRVSATRGSFGYIYGHCPVCDVVVREKDVRVWCVSKA